MDNLDTREWLLTNGLGSFASGTVSDARTRTYHGWLIASLDPPSRRTLLLSHIEATLEVGGQVWALGTNFWGDGTIAPLGYQHLRYFAIDPVPTWIWSGENWQLTRQLVMPYGLLSSGESGKTSNPQFCNRTLIKYRYEGSLPAILRLRPLIGDRDFHHQQLGEAGFYFSQLVIQRQVTLQASKLDWLGTPWHLRWSDGDYQPEGVWYWNYSYPEEQGRGLGGREDLYNPGYLTITMQPGAVLILEAKVGWPEPGADRLSALEFEQAVQAQEERVGEWERGRGEKFLNSQSPKPNTDDIWPQLLKAGDRFIAYRASIAGPTVIAGYPWFNDWGRDTLIALPGLALTTQRFDLAKGLLQTFGRYCKSGLIPNTFPDAGSEPFYNSIDAALWWIEILGLYLEATQDWDFLAEQYPVVRQIYKAFCGGTIYNINVDATDGLLAWDAVGVALTWMDVVIDGQPITPRRGKPIEINALWYSALCWATEWANRLAREKQDKRESFLKQAERYTLQAEQVKVSLKQFWNPETGYFYDTIEPDSRPNAQIRPNAVVALSLHHCGFTEERARQVLRVARDRLLTPYGLRSLDPSDPDYIGRYGGDRIHRDRAYHQGTVWSWLIGPFIRAWQRFYPDAPLPFDWQLLREHFQNEACLGSISEIFDGDIPHSAQGAFAQAWSVAEIIRHWYDRK
ncbi:amylo-alpha-1,6-glucosidase [Aerosakkonema funiforme]|uniref:amylo-alpha-1,6-glucosidase n=1 Tax=Aerosakkonema funiforme TaxID=1246630 RepID=UPI0035BA5210